MSITLGGQRVEGGGITWIPMVRIRLAESLIVLFQYLNNLDVILIFSYPFLM